MDSRLVIVGAGPIGSAVAKAALDDGVATSALAVVDPDPEPRESLCSALDAEGFEAVGHLPYGSPGDVAVVAFTSHANAATTEIERLLGLGYHVVTTCEELSWPKQRIRDTLDALARTAGRVAVATGANPGFVMDRLPLAVAAASRNIRAITVERRVDTSARRSQLVAKTGWGLSTDQFATRVSSGSIGHVGLETSARMLAEGLRLKVDDVTASIEPVVDDSGRVEGVHQRVELEVDDGPRVVYELVMAWDVDRPGDTIDVDGDPPIHIEIAGGYHGDHGTVAQVVDAINRCQRLEPGFYRPTDLPLRLG